MIGLLVVEDHPLVRSGLIELFALTDDIRVRAEASSGAQLQGCLAHQRYDLVLLDLDLPDGSGIDLIAQIHRVDADLPVLMLSMHDEKILMRRALQAGASAYVRKDSDLTLLPVLVRRLVRDACHGAPG